MKKNLLMLALVASATSFATVTGTFKLNTENGAKHVPAKTFQSMIEETTSKVTAETELKLGESGVTLGAKLSLNHKPADGAVVVGIDGNVKYDIDTKVEGLKTYIKGGASFDSDSSNYRPKVNGELGISYKKNDFTYGLTTKTNAPFNMVDFNSTHEAKITGKKGKLTDLLVRAELGHGYNVKYHPQVEGKEAVEAKPDAQPPVEAQPAVTAQKAYLELNGPLYVQGEFKAEVEVKEGLKLTGHDLLTADILGKGQKEVKSTILGKLTHDKSVSNLADLKLSYKQDKFDVAGTGMFDFNYTADNTMIGYGAKVEGKYNPVESVTLTADALMGGKFKVTYKTNTQPASASEHKGMIKLNAGVEYKGKVTDKLTITPTGKLSLSLGDITKEKVNKVDLTLKPAIALKVAASEKVTLNGSLETPVSFTLKGDTFGYKETGFTAKLGLEYNF